MLKDSRIYQWRHGLFIGAGFVITFLFYFFPGTLETVGYQRVIQEIGMVSLVAVIMSFLFTRINLKGSVLFSSLATFLIVDLVAFVPKLSHLTDQEKQMLPTALIFYPLSVAPAVIGICLGTRPYFRKK